MHVSAEDLRKRGEVQDLWDDMLGNTLSVTVEHSRTFSKCPGVTTGIRKLAALQALPANVAFSLSWVFSLVGAAARRVVEQHHRSIDCII